MAGPIIRAAGGIVQGPGRHKDKIIVVHRRRYEGDVSLPKGKHKRGESDEAAAVREVREETGYDVRIISFAGTTEYSVKGAPKVVTYFLMEITGERPVETPDPSEIDGLSLMTPQEAATRLTHVEDRELIAAVFGL